MWEIYTIPSGFLDEVTLKDANRINYMYFGFAEWYLFSWHNPYEMHHEYFLKSTCRSPVESGVF